MMSETGQHGMACTGRITNVQATRAAVTTGIYCVPWCSARPRPEHVRDFGCAAAAEAAGFRACRRCRPYRIDLSPPKAALPGAALAHRAVTLISGSYLDHHNEQDLANKLGTSTRHLRRLLHQHTGATPVQLARTRRAHFARRLLDETDLNLADVAFAAGFGSVRQFNRVMADVFREPPQALRARRHRADRVVTDGGLALRLPRTLDLPAWLSGRAQTAIAGLETINDHGYRRVILVHDTPGMIEIVPSDGPALVVHLPQLDHLIDVYYQARSLLDIDSAEPTGWDAHERAVRSAFLSELGPDRGTLALGAFVLRHGRLVPGLAPLGLHHAFPTPAELVGHSRHGTPSPRNYAPSDPPRSSHRVHSVLEKSVPAID
jgi:AraC family transcriptional regulator of adaptative response / DNA-3-methyladenine glycosylase II